MKRRSQGSKVEDNSLDKNSAQSSDGNVSSPPTPALKKAKTPDVLVDVDADIPVDVNVPLVVPPVSVSVSVSVSGVVDPQSNIDDGKIVLLNNGPCDCMLVKVDPTRYSDKFFVLQLVRYHHEHDDKVMYDVYKRRGRTGTQGQEDSEEGFDNLSDAVKAFEKDFTYLTGLDWNNRDSPPMDGEYRLIQQNLAEKEDNFGGGMWQYWVDDGVSGKTTGWHDYDQSASRHVEQLFHEHNANTQLSVRLIESGNWTYSVDFVQMTQTNIQHPNRTSRRIRRLPTRQAASQPQATSQAAVAAALPPPPPHSSPSKTITETITYTAPSSMVDVAIAAIIPATPPTGSDSEECVICLTEMTPDEDIVKFDIIGCSHVFHKECIKKSVQFAKPCCPVCRKQIDDLKGYCPSGRMSISTINRVCRGYESSIGTIVIKYELLGDVQKEYHPNPGVNFQGITRIAYLPDTDEGKALLLRLKYSFMKGLSFTVGTSMTSGVPNSITWSSIHHKTNMNSGAIYHGFPDDNYFVNCNFELDALEIPNATDIDTLPHQLINTPTATSIASTPTANSIATPTRQSRGIARALALMTVGGATPSHRQIQAGILILDEIRDKLNGGSVIGSFAELSSRFYTAIPHHFGRRRPPVISTHTALQYRYDACDSLLQRFN